MKDNNEKQRKLSPAEQRRLENFNIISDQLAEQGYVKTELTVGIVKANVITLIAAVPIFVIGIALFFLLNDVSDLNFQGTGFVLFIVIFAALVLAHELIHGITWAIFAEHHFKDIEMGFMKEYLTPYCTCKVPLSKGAYIAGALMPLIVLGIIPTVIGIVCGSFLLLLLGLIMIISAGGDMIIVWLLLRYKSNSKDILLFDHPTQAGSVVFERK